ncbi:MAG: PEP-CTERM sorting domain-containing protein [Gemmataceae bacterium]
MSLIRIWRWSALAIAFGLFGSAVRAEMITPNSIPNPPSAVGSTNGTLVYSSNYVTNQYASSGLQFAGTAITQLNGVSVWAPLGIAVSDPAPAGAINYAWGLSGSLVSPASSNPMTVSSLSVDVMNLSGIPTVSVNGDGQLSSIVPTYNVGPGASVSEVWTFTGTDINGFSISPPSTGGAWGVTGVAFTPTTATAPEPSSLVLAGLGALGLAARWRWRRVRAVVA